MTTANLSQTTQGKQGTLRNLLWVSPLAMAAGSFTNVVLYQGAGLIFPEVTAWAGASVSQIIGANIVYLLIGTVVLALVARFSSQPVRHYTLIATIGVVLSLFLPVSAAFGYGAPGVPAASAITAVTLSAMHIITYAISVPMFNRFVLR